MERFDYRSLTPEMITESFEQSLDEAERHLTRAVAGGSPRSFENTLEPVGDASRAMWNGAGRGPFMTLVHPNPQLREVAGEALQRFLSWNESLPSRDEVARAILDYAATDEAAALEGERRRVLRLWVRDVRRAGHERDEPTRKEVSELRSRLRELAHRFTRSVNEWTDEIVLAPDDAAGLSEAFLAQLPSGETPGSKRLTLTGSTVETFLRQSTRRDLRELVQRRWLTRVPDNRVILEEILALRCRMARLLGYASWSDYANEARMSGSATAVAEFLDGVIEPLRGQAERERQDMQALPEAPEDAVASWDWLFLTERQRSGMADPRQLDAYLPLERVLDGLFAISADVFGIEVTPLAEPMAWDDSVRLVALRDLITGDELAHVYLDLFSRAGKVPNGLQVPLRYPSYGVDGRTPAVVLISLMAVPPQPGATALLSRGDVETLFHEFGHALETATSRARSVAGNFWWGEQDFAEAPSQIMENWTWEPDVLKRFARHYETGAPPPDSLLEAICATRGLNVAIETLWNFAYRAVLDQLLHGPEPVDLDDAYREAFAVTGFPFPEGTFQPAAFNHLAMDYDAGFYGYLWAHVFGDDMFSVFRQGGVLSSGVGRRYRREILEPSWTVPAEERLRGFLGREPSRAAFLRRLGLNERT